MSLEEQLKKIVGEYFELSERSDCFLVDIIQKIKKLEIYIDSDDAIDFDICRNLSRTVEQYLDETMIMGDDYILEVSSPGLSKPLKLARQYKKNLGREVTMTNADKIKTVGILTYADDDNFQITSKVTRKEGKKKITEDLIQTVPYSEGRKVLINIKF